MNGITQHPLFDLTEYLRLKSEGKSDDDIARLWDYHRQVDKREWKRERDRKSYISRFEK